MINGATCNAGDLSGCAPVAEIPMGDPEANVGSIDDATHTLYAADPFSDTVAVINTAACNATHTTGCAHHPPLIKVGPFPSQPVLEPVTRSLYVPVGQQANQVAVLNAATCNAEHTSGCGQKPAVVPVRPGTFVLAVSIATDTVYAPGIGPMSAPFSGDTVAVINGATCNGSNTSGCAQRHPVITVGRSPNLVTVDTRTDIVYVADFASAAVSVFNGSGCRAGVTSGCRRAARLLAVGSLPASITVNPLTSTVYVPQAFRPASMSIFHATP